MSRTVRTGRRAAEELGLEKEMKRRKQLLLAEQRREAGEEKAAPAPGLSEGAAAQASESARGLSHYSVSSYTSFTEVAVPTLAVSVYFSLNQCTYLRVF